jgi:hypothetical protein
VPFSWPHSDETIDGWVWVHQNWFQRFQRQENGPQRYCANTGQSMNTLLLDQVTWDLTKDAAGNIAMASNPYAIAQDVASATRLFLGELWYDTTQGVPYFQQILGKLPPAQFIKAALVQAGLTTPETKSIVCYLTGFVNRELTGQLQITDIFQNKTSVTFGGGQVTVQ